MSPTQNTPIPNLKTNCSSSDCGCGQTLPLSRRGFFGGCQCNNHKLGSCLLQQKMVLAQDGQSFEDLIPSNKKLAPAWIKSLYDRGEPEVFTGWNEQLKYIGMPIGGIGCGQLYLGGDGRLWLWDIFKCNYRREPDHGQRINSMTLGGHLRQPDRPSASSTIAGTELTSARGSPCVSVRVAKQPRAHSITKGSLA